MKSTYGKLFNLMRGLNKGTDDPITAFYKEYVTFTAMQGHRYNQSEDIFGNPFRLMMVGRAVNGWDEYRPVGEFSEEEFIQASIENLNNDKKALSYGKDRFEWIWAEGNTAKNCLREGIDRSPSDIGKYLLTRSPLWSYTKDIWSNLYGKQQRWEERWFENIVWSNLYKIAPHESGNPSGKLMKYQKDVCLELLKREVEYFKPTHILFITGKDWFSPFTNIFDEVRFRKANCASGVNKNNIYVEGTGCYRFAEGDNAKIIIACRPEMRNKEDYTKQVSEFLVEQQTIKNNEIEYEKN